MHALFLFALLAPACERPVRPDDMSAQSHRREAAKETAAARAHIQDYDSNAVGLAPHSATREPDAMASTAVIDDYNPTTWNLQAASEHRAHAAEHERAAADLERFESSECAGLKPSVRSACPFLGPVRASEEIAGGVRVTLAPGAPIAAVAAHMRCHLAFARTRAFEVSECPLTLRGTEIKLSADGTAIEITARDRRVVRDLRTRAAALVAPSR
jgi:hypothetical protein